MIDLSCSSLWVPGVLWKWCGCAWIHHVVAYVEAAERRSFQKDFDSTRRASFIPCFLQVLCSSQTVFPLAVLCVFGWHKSKSSEADCSLSVWSAWHDISYSLLGLLVVEEAIRAAICFWTHSIDWYREHPAPSACILRKMQQPQYIFYCWSRTHAPCWYSALILGTFISIQVFCL